VVLIDLLPGDYTQTQYTALRRAAHGLRMNEQIKIAHVSEWRKIAGKSIKVRGMMVYKLKPIPSPGPEDLYVVHRGQRSLVHCRRIFLVP
jgi:hypothetical protein